MRRRVPVLLSSLALATVGLGISQPARADVNATLPLSTVNTATFTHPASGCAAGSTTSGHRVTQLSLHSNASGGDPLSITVTPTTPGFDVGFAVYDGPFSPGSPTSHCYDTTNLQGPGVAESASYQSFVTGTTYTIVVFGTSGDGDYSLHLTGPDLASLASTPEAPRIRVAAPTAASGSVSTHLTVVNHDDNGSTATGAAATLTDATTASSSGATTFTDLSGGTDLSTTGAPGDDLTLKVTLTNAIGAGPATVIQRVPAPGVVSLVPGPDGTSAQLSWTRPGTATEHEGLFADAAQVGSLAAPPAPAALLTSPTTITGLAEGQTYTVHTVTLNELDSVSGPDVTVTTMSRPGAPTLTAGSTPSTITIGAAPVVAGSSPVSTYTVTATAPGQETVTTSAPAARTVHLLTLQPGTTYTVTATATNTVGTGAASAPLTVTTPPPTVSTPIRAVIPSPHTLKVFFTPPGGPVVLTAVPVDGGPSLSTTGSASPLKVTGLTDRRSYALFITNVGAEVPLGGGRVTHSGPAPKVTIVLPHSPLAAGRRATVSGTFFAGGVPQQGATVALTRTLHGRTTTIGKHQADRHGAVRFTVTATPGASFVLVAKIFTVAFSSRRGSLRLV